MDKLPGPRSRLQPILMGGGGVLLFALIFAQTVVTTVMRDLTLTLVVGSLCFVMGRMSKK